MYFTLKLLECTLLGSISLCRLKFDFPESDSDSDECAQPKTEPDFYDGDTELPVFSRMDHGCPVDTLIKTLLPQSLDEKRVCKVQPLGVQANAAFLIDLNTVPFKDIKADDLGVWKATGTKRTHFRFTQCNSIRYASGVPSKSSDYFLLTQRYYIHGTYNHFHRIISDIKGNNCICRAEFVLCT